MAGETKDLIAESPVSSPISSATAKEQFSSMAEERNNSVDGSAVTSAKEDFFNLAGTTSISAVSDDKPCAKFLCDSRQQSANQNVVDFWNTDVQTEDWTHPEKIWGPTSDVTCSQLGRTDNKIANSVSETEVSEIKGYRSNRYQSDISSEMKTSAMKRSCFTVHHKIAPRLHTSAQSTNRIPKKVFRVLPGHSGTVNRIHWSVPEYSHLLLTASMDATVRVWNVLCSSDSDPCVRTLRVHGKAVKAARWSACGRHILSCGYDKFAKLTDVECGKVLSLQSSVLTCYCILYPALISYTNTTAEVFIIDLLLLFLRPECVLIHSVSRLDGIEDS